MSKELKPCPFCGGEAVYSKEDTSETVPFGTMQHFVTCKNNCLEGLYARGNTKEEAIKAWNRRPSVWQTETPTKGGWYLLKVMHEDEIVYDANLLEDNTDDLQWRYAMSMHGKVIAYKEIEP